MRLTQNVGTPDRVVRFIIAAALAAVALSGLVAGPLAIVALVAAGVMLVTGLVGFCPLYAIVGFSSCPIRR